MKSLLLTLALLTGLTCFGQDIQPCNFHTSAAHNAGGIYVGNSQPGRFILIGSIEVPVPCITTQVSFFASHIDSVSLTNHYEMSLYCIDGDCTPLSRVLDTGLLTTTQFFPYCPSGDYLGQCALTIRKGQQVQVRSAQYGQELETLPWAEGTTILHAGHYALAMGSDCIDPATNSSNGNCGEAYGEDGSLAQVFDFKVFTGMWPTWKRCLVWTNGLPDTLCVTPVVNPTNAAPHMIDFTIQ